jgi:hypothetical protein
VTARAAQIGKHRANTANTESEWKIPKGIKIQFKDVEDRSQVYVENIAEFERR